MGQITLCVKKWRQDLLKNGGAHQEEKRESWINVLWERSCHWSVWAVSKHWTTNQMACSCEKTGFKIKASKKEN